MKQEVAYLYQMIVYNPLLGRTLRARLSNYIRIIKW